MQFVCFLCPAIVSVFFLKTKPEGKDVISDIRMYILSLAVVNALTNLLYYLFISQNESAWNQTADNGLTGAAYIGMALIIAIIWGVFAEYMVQRFTVAVEARERKKVIKDEKKDNK